jgi:hypothetical protein
MAAKKKASSKGKRAKVKTARVSTPRAAKVLTVRERARLDGAEPNRKAPRSEAWTPEWLALFTLTEGSPETFAQTIGVTYQTINRVGLKGDSPGKWTAFLIRQFAANHGLKSPV